MKDSGSLRRRRGVRPAATGAVCSATPAGILVLLEARQEHRCLLIGKSEPLRSIPEGPWWSCP